MDIKKAVIPAAGLGTRFLPATKVQPKEMLPIVDIPAIQYIISEAVNSGIEDILIITGKNKRAIEDHFDMSLELELHLQRKGKIKLLDDIKKISSLANIHYIRQKEPKGLGHAIYCAKAFVGNEPFAILLGDDIVYSPCKPCLKQLIEVYNKYQKTIIGVQKVPENDVSKYGIISVQDVKERIYKVNTLVEKPNIQEAPSNIAILGRYILEPTIFEILEKTKKGIGGEIQLTDALKKYNEKNDIYAYEFSGKRYDIGNKMGFLMATVEFALRRESLSGQFKDYLARLLKDMKK